MAAQWVMFCEAAADYRTASGLIDRVLRERGADWVGDLLDHTPDAVRVWHGDQPGRSYFDLHGVARLAASYGLRKRHGHFGERPIEPGAVMLHTFAQVVRKLRRDRPNAGERWALVLVWDMDKQGDSRRGGLSQARSESTALLGTGAALVIGCPDPNREAWVLAGFEPTDTNEAAALERERQRLGYFPNQSPERLTAQDEQAVHNTKRVLAALCRGDSDREAACLRDAPLDLLRARGTLCELTAFLASIGSELAPQVDPAAARRGPPP